MRKRGPDSLGSKCIFLHADEAVEGEVITKESELIDNLVLNNGVFGKILFIGATLQLRGVYPITQPLVDKSRNILVYNGMVPYTVN